MTWERSAGRESGQALYETLLMVWLLTLLISAIIQVFLVHNYTFQMANNAYYSLFKDKAYGEYKDAHKKGFAGYPNWPKKPLRAVEALQQAGGRRHTLAGGEINWSEDDRAAVPMMPFFENHIVLQLRNMGVTREDVRLKLGKRAPGRDYLDMRFLWMAMGTKGGFGAFINMIKALVKMATRLGHSSTEFTEGYSEDYLGSLEDQYGDQADELGGHSEDEGQKAKDTWDEKHFDFDHDGYMDIPPYSKNDRPWESGS